MSTPLVIHIVRPYESEDAYLAAEAWSIDGRSMVLIGQRRLPAETAVLFDVALASGQKVIKAEAKVLSSVAAKGDRPGGVRVRFKRFGATTKAFIDRAIQLNRQALETAAEAASAAGGAETLDVPRELASSPAALPAERQSMPEVTTDRLSVPEPAVEPPSTPQASEPMSAPEAPAPPLHVDDRSGIHRRVAAPVPAPPNREELLEKLRLRSRALAKARQPAPASEEAG